MLGFDQRNPHHCYDVWEHTLHAMEAAPPTPLLRWTVLFHDMGKPECFALDEKEWDISWDMAWYPAALRRGR